VTIGQLIKEARKKKQMTQKQLAEKLGISYVNISQLENNQRTPKYETLKYIAAALGVNWIDLVPEGQQAQTVIEHMKDKLKNAKPLKKMTESEEYREDYLPFHSEEDRIAHFYSRLNTDGRLAAGACFFQYLDKDKLSEVADYVMSLSENPLYQITEVEKTTSDGEQSE